VWLIHVDDDRDELGSERDITLARATGAEWALFLDTDEFYVPASGSLHGLPELDEADILSVESYDVALTADMAPRSDGFHREEYDHILVNSHGPEPDKWPKIMARPEAVANMIDGYHAATPEPGEWRQAIARELVIAHLPFTTVERFERKVANIRRFHDRDPEWFADGRGSHWLEWLHMDDAGRTQEVFNSWFLEPPEIERLRQDGSIRSVEELLASRRVSIEG